MTGLDALAFGAGVLAGSAVATAAARLLRAPRQPKRSPLGRVEGGDESLAEAASDGFYRWDVSGRFTHCSAAGARLLGCSPDELLRLRLGDVVDSRFLPLVQLRPDEFATPGKTLERCEVLFHARSGEPLWLELRGRLVKGRDGEGIVEVVAHDVTRYRRALDRQSAVPELRRMLADAMARDDALPAVLEAVARQLELEYVELWRIDEEFAVTRLVDLWHETLPQLESFAEASRKRTLAKGHGLVGRAWSLGESLAVSDLGGESAHDVRELAARAGFATGIAVPARAFGRTVGVLVGLGTRPGKLRLPSRDVLEAVSLQIGQLAERRRAETALRVSEARKQAVLECALDCVITIDHLGRVLEFNPAAQKTFGWSRSDVLGQPLARLIIPEELRPRFEAGLARCLETSALPLGGQRVEFEAQRSDGSRVPVEIAVVRIDVGPAPMFSAYLRDISDRREVERMKDEMVSTVSHELRTPLSSLRGFVELLLTRDYPRDEQRRFLSIVDQEIGRLTKLINEFLDVQRLEAGGPQFHFEKCELQSLLRDSLEVIRARGGPHVFTLSVPEPAITVSADADAIRQVMMNLLSNAVKFSPNGGSIAVRAEVSGGHALVGVRDAGIGMSPDTVGKLFAKFFRADNSATRSIEGTGLGLALVKQIVTQHGGEVGVTSELGHGSEFTFTLELAKPEDEPA